MRQCTCRGRLGLERGLDRWREASEGRRARAAAEGIEVGKASVRGSLAYGRKGHKHSMQETSTYPDAALARVVLFFVFLFLST